MKTIVCQGCEEQEATHRVTLVDVDDVIEDTVALCNDCLSSIGARIVAGKASLTI